MVYDHVKHFKENKDTQGMGATIIILKEPGENTELLVKVVVFLWELTAVHLFQKDGDLTAGNEFSPLCKNILHSFVEKEEKENKEMRDLVGEREREIDS